MISLIIFDGYDRFKSMSKKSVLTFVVFLVLGVVVTYGVAIVDSFMNTSASKSGLPFKFGSYSLFGGASTDFGLLLLNIIFWSVALWVIWKIFSKLLGR
ncbi:MAG: hypothetical protein Q8P87_00420 [bacterium]|nr:hypothetical protein [bacterium]